jgi:hypothetical protein
MRITCVLLVVSDLGLYSSVEQVLLEIRAFFNSICDFIIDLVVKPRHRNKDGRLQ